MNKMDAYRLTLRGLAEWDDYLLSESGLPGPRGNLELLYAVVEEGSAVQFKGWVQSMHAQRAPTGLPEEYLAACGTAGLGRLLAEGDESVLPMLRSLAADPRWRVREGVAMALQRLGKQDMPRLLHEMNVWLDGSLFELRAAAAGLCEPVLLKNEAASSGTLRILDEITGRLAQAGAAERRTEEFRVLRQALAYCWSVAVAANPVAGKPLFERWAFSIDRDVRWMVRENLKKNRLARMDAEWKTAWQQRMSL